MKYVAVDIENGLGIVSLNRPDRRNSIGVELAAELLEAVGTVAHDKACRAVLLRGEGSSFCVGGDVADMEGDHQGKAAVHDRVAFLRKVVGVCELLHRMPKPTLAAIHGAAAGGGLSLALACDLRIAAASTKITTAFAKIGLSGDFGGSWFMTRLLGSARARELYLLSPLLTGTEAYRIGLVTRVVPDEEFAAAARAMADSLAAGPSAVLGMMKHSLNAAEDADLGSLLDLETRNHIMSSLTEDHLEAAHAFIDKRAPVFRGV